MNGNHAETYVRNFPPYQDGKISTVHFLGRLGQNLRMDIEQKERLARTRDTSIEAAAIRLKAARHVTGISQQAIADELGMKKSSISSVESGKAYASRPLMVYFYRNHRIDFNFLIHGDFSQLPSDVQDSLFSELSKIESGKDRITSSN